MIDPQYPDFTNTPVSDRRPHFGYAGADLTAEPCVTIVTPYYNGSQIFHETAQTVFNQSLQQWEWLIVNDGSTDSEALEILNHYRGIDPRVRVIDLPENKGPGAARNAGYQAAASRYICMLDCDDLLEPTAIEKWLWFLEAYPECSFVKGFSIGFGAYNYLWNDGFHSGKEFLHDNQVDISSLIRKDVHTQVGGYDAVERDGLEDWDFWLRCANAGYWGSTIPEHLNWYRRRKDHTDRWPNWDESIKQGKYSTLLRSRYPSLWERDFPSIAWRSPLPNEWVADTLPCENVLSKTKPRVLLIVPWLTTGGADKFNLDLTEQLTRRGWEITIAATVGGDNSWQPNFGVYTPDIFILNHFLRLPDYPRFLRYLIGSRQIDTVIVTHSELGYLLLPYLRSHFPSVSFVDYTHIVEEYWKNGGYPRMALDFQEQLDMNIVASQHIKDWMQTHQADPRQIEVCYINVDPDIWHPDSSTRASVRDELGISPDTPVILFAGRILAQKQPPVLAKTLLNLQQRGLKFVALVAGNGPQFEWLNSYVQKHQLSANVHLLGEVPNQRVRDLMTAADIFFLPSRWEGIALVLYEAMASGLPVVGADVGGQRELVTPECGILIELADEDTQVQGYSDVLADLMAKPETRQAFGQAGHERVSSLFPLDQMGERMVRLLTEARDCHAANPRPVPSPSLGHTIASQAVEYIRLSQVADALWEERMNPPQLLHERTPVGWRGRTYAKLYRWHEPVYHWYTRRGLDWFSPFRNKIKQWFLK